MLNHRLVTAFFAIGIGLVFIFCKLGTPCFYLTQMALLYLYLSIEFAGAYFIGLNFHLTSLNHLDKNQNKIALTFDDGPSGALARVTRNTAHPLPRQQRNQ